MAFIAVLASLAPPATATYRYWGGGSGQWDTPIRRDSFGLSQEDDFVYLTNGYPVPVEVTYYNTTNPAAVLGSLRIDATSIGTMTLDMPNAHTLYVQSEYLGYEGQGAVAHSAGTHVAGTLFLGYGAAGDGIYTMTGGTLVSTPVASTSATAAPAR